MPSSKWIRAVILLAAGLWAAIMLISGESLKWSWAKPLGLVASAVIFIVAGFDRWAWRWPILRKLTKRPILVGTWRVELRTSYKGRRDEVIEAFLVVRQTYSTICVDMLFDRSQSTSMSGDLVTEDGKCVLYYVFRSDKNTLERKGNPPSRGAAELTVDRHATLRLEGDYWMEHGTHGRVSTTGHSSVIYESYSSANNGDYA
jgi:hypothetical protein